jgi:hypothetical protein
MTPDRSGPHIQAAFFCERVLQEKDGVLSAIRIIDRVIFQVPEGERPPSQHLTLMVALKSGDARGTYPLAISMERPSGEQVPSPLSVSVFLEGEERGANVMVPVRFDAEMPGLYWFDVLFDGRVITRVPLRAIYQQVQIHPET